MDADVLKAGTACNALQRAGAQNVDVRLIVIRLSQAFTGVDPKNVPPDEEEQARLPRPLGPVHEVPAVRRVNQDPPAWSQPRTALLQQLDGLGDRKVLNHVIERNGIEQSARIERADVAGKQLWLEAEHLAVPLEKRRANADHLCIVVDADALESLPCEREHELAGAAPDVKNPCARRSILCEQHIENGLLIDVDPEHVAHHTGWRVVL